MIKSVEEMKTYIEQISQLSSEVGDTMTAHMDEIVVLTDKMLVEIRRQDDIDVSIVAGAAIQILLQSAQMLGDKNEPDTPHAGFCKFTAVFALIMTNTAEKNELKNIGTGPVQ